MEEKTLLEFILAGGEGGDNKQQKESIQYVDVGKEGGKVEKEDWNLKQRSLYFICGTTKNCIVRLTSEERPLRGEEGWIVQ